MSRSAEEREAARLERERRRAEREGRTPPPEPPVPAEPKPEPETPLDVRSSGGEIDPPTTAAPPEPPVAQPTQQFDVASEWTEEHPVAVAEFEREIPLGTKRVKPHEHPRRAAAANRPARPARPPREPGSLGRRAAAIVALGLIVVVGWFLNALYQPFAGEGSGKVEVKIPSGASVGEVADLLAAEGVIDSAFFFELRTKVGGGGEEIKSGAHTLALGMSYADALDALSKSPKAPPVLTVTIPEGRSRGETAPLVRRAGIEGSYANASRAARGFDVRRYGAPRGTSLEGFLFPATYELKRNATAQDLVAAQLKAFKQNLATIDLAYARSKNLTVYDVLIIASMVEREVAVAKERPLVAAVIYNRLKAGISLGIDATLRFGLNNWTEPLKVSELESDDPYNTRNRVGLPPGPIGNPGLASIEAAAKPAKVDYLFYVVKPGTCGEHAFSATDAEFQRDVAAYNAARDAAGGKSPTKC